LRELRENETADYLIANENLQGVEGRCITGHADEAFAVKASRVRAE
jgi:hypothetical protein